MINRYFNFFYFIGWIMLLIQIFFTAWMPEWYLNWSWLVILFILSIMIFKEIILQRKLGLFSKIIYVLGYLSLAIELSIIQLMPNWYREYSVYIMLLILGLIIIKQIFPKLVRD